MRDLRSPLTLEEYLQAAEEKLSNDEIEILFRNELMTDLARRVIALEKREW